MKKVICVFFITVLSLLLMTACGCEHDWENATCEKPATCKTCGEVAGETLGHHYKDATCANPQTCVVCGKTEGEALGHTWVDATCEELKHCSVCNRTFGTSMDLGHKWVRNSCDGVESCVVCKKINAGPREHIWYPATYQKPKTCVTCGDIEGFPLQYDLGVNVTDFEANINLGLSVLGYQLDHVSTEHDEDVSFKTYNILPKDKTSANPNVQVVFVLQNGCNNVYEIMCGTNTGDDLQSVSVTSYCFGLAAAFVDPEFGDDDIKALEKNMTTVGRTTFCTYSDKGFDYQMIETILSDSETELVMKIFPTQPET